MSRTWLALLLLGCGGGTAMPDAEIIIDAQPLDAFVPAVEFPLTSVEDGVAYTASITIGGTQTFALDVDTGSTTLGVAATVCAGCGVTPEYTPGAAAIDRHETTSALYGDGTSWMGEVFSDTVEVAGDNNVTMKFASINMESGFFRGNNDDQGIIGFGGIALATMNADSFIAQRKAAHLSTAFAFQFCQESGKLWLGGFDPTATSAPPQYAPLVPEAGFYEVAVQSATIGTTQLGLTGNAIADTGTSLMIIPGDVESALLNAVRSSAGFQTLFPTGVISESTCLDGTGVTSAQIDAALPPLTVTMPDPNGVPFTLTLAATQSYLLESQGSYCLGVAAIEGLPTIFGDTFLRAFVTEFDLPNFRIGFAPEVGCATPAAHFEHPATPVKPPHYYIRGHRR